MRKYLAGLVSILAVGAVTASPALAHTHQLFTKNPAEGGVLLRSVTTGPNKDQPDALEFNNNGPMVAILEKTTTKGKIELPERTVNCAEVEFGTTVLSDVEDTVNAEGVLQPGLVKLAMPFGVAEGQECAEPAGAAIPTYFDTTGTGYVPADITVSLVGANVIAKITGLKLSQNFGGTWCTETLTIEGTLRNPTSGLVEEKEPNLNLEINAQPITALCVTSTNQKVTVKGHLYANFFLDTMSTTTDTVWVG